MAEQAGDQMEFVAIAGAAGASHPAAARRRAAARSESRPRMALAHSSVESTRRTPTTSGNSRGMPPARPATIDVQHPHAVQRRGEAAQFVDGRVARAREVGVQAPSADIHVLQHLQSALSPPVGGYLVGVLLGWPRFRPGRLASASVGTPSTRAGCRRDRARTAATARAAAANSRTALIHSSGGARHGAAFGDAPGRRSWSWPGAGAGAACACPLWCAAGALVTETRRGAIVSRMG